MSKEYLEALKKVKYNSSLEVVKCFDIIQQALERLEQIDNAKPSEALKNFEEIGEMFYIEDGNIDGDEILYLKGYEKFNTIKQTLLKAQEQKQYLKWEDLEFSYGTKYQKVRMGDTIYKIAYRCCDGTKEVRLLSEDEKFLYVSSFSNYEDNIQLFNNLHLEKVDENSNV